MYKRIIHKYGWAGKILLTFVSVTLTISLLTVQMVNAQADTPTYPTDNDVNAIAKKLYCPVCPNTPLDVCETKACEDWRAQIREQLAAGWTEEQIMDYFVEQYGERVLAEPQRTGFTSFVWITPLIAMLLGLAIVWQVLKNWRSRTELVPAPEPGDPDISPELLARLEKELQEID